MQHKIVAPRLIFSDCPESESSNKKLRCGRVFMENMNEGSMQLLCLLISPQGWGTLRLYSFTTTDGLLRDVHCASPGCVCICVCVCVCVSWVVDQTHSCLLKRSPWISGHESGCQTSSHMILLTNDMLDIQKSVCVCVCVWRGGVYERFWGSSLQMDWDLTGISMSCWDGVMKSLPLTKIAFTLQRCLAIGACAP